MLPMFRLNISCVIIYMKVQRKTISNALYFRVLFHHLINLLIWLFHMQTMRKTMEWFMLPGGDLNVLHR